MTSQQYWQILDQVATQLCSTDLGASTWREFHCHCCRRVWDLILDRRSRMAVEKAEQYLAGVIGLDALREAAVDAEVAADEAWDNVMRLKMSDSHLWPLSDEVDAAWVRMLGCSAAKETVQLDLRPSIIPDAAAGVRAWAFARRNLRELDVDVDLESARDLVQQEWDQLNAAEQEAQLQLLLNFARPVPISEDQPPD